MALRDRAQAFLDRAAGATPLAMVASYIADAFDSQGVAAGTLEAAAESGEPLIANILASLPAEDVAGIRGQGAGLARLIPRIAYGAIVELLGLTHPAHARVLFAHRDWTVSQLDAARRWMVDGSS